MLLSLVLTLGLCLYGSEVVYTNEYSLSASPFYLFGRPPTHRDMLLLMGNFTLDDTFMK